MEEGDGLRQSEERSLINIQQLESERDEIQQKLKVSERRAEVAAKAAERNHALLRRDCQKLESSNANLMQRCRYLHVALELSTVLLEHILGNLLLNYRGIQDFFCVSTTKKLRMFQDKN